MIDEFPILFVAAALAAGRTVARGLDELRVKESDRITTMAEGLRACGATVEELADGLMITGTGGEALAGGSNRAIASHLDHRIAMSFAVAGLVSRAPVTIDDFRPVATSFPGFVELMTGLGTHSS
jgi:3-phosphoshikimate 1-carboxyvinyltransferase